MTPFWLPGEMKSEVPEVFIYKSKPLLETHLAPSINRSLMCASFFFFSFFF